jgi:hypothetical protein
MGKVISMNGNGAEKRSTRGPSINQVVLCGRLGAWSRIPGFTSRRTDCTSASSGW